MAEADKKLTREVRYVGPTGELIEFTERGTDSVRVPGGFCSFSNLELDKFLDSDELTAEDKIIFMRLVTRCQYGNDVSFTKTGLAKELGKHRVAIGRTVDKFTTMGVLVKTRTRDAYIISPHIGWKGGGGHRSNAFHRIREISEQRASKAGQS